MAHASRPVAPGHRQPVHQPPQPAHAPVRWPHPQAAGVVWTLVWALGLLIGVVAPAMVVSPLATSAPTGRALGAFGLTVVGIVISLAGFVGLRRRYHQGGLAALAVAPTSALLIGGIALLGEFLSR